MPVSCIYLSKGNKKVVHNENYIYERQNDNVKKITYGRCENFYVCRERIPTEYDATEQVICTRRDEF